MNGSIIRYILGQVLKIEGVLMMLLPGVTALLYKEAEGFAYLLVAILCILIGLILSYKKPQDQLFYLKEGCVTTALSWIVMSVFGALPFVLSGEIPSFTDAMFEMVSGFTTTGSSILTDIESMSHCALIWRSFSHWIGGMGVLVFLLAIVPLNGGSHMNLMKAESPGPSVGKLVPKVKSTAQILYLIYIGMSIILAVLLLCSGMPLFDTLCTTFGTAGTGGFGIKSDSIASYSTLQMWIVAVFMILFGVNFNAFYYIVFRKFKKAMAMEEIRWYFLIIFLSIGFITFNILPIYGNVFASLTHAAFQVGTIISTTGFATADFNCWPVVSKTILVLLTFLGACAGSTGGGFKVSRLVMLGKSVLVELDAFIHPKRFRKVYYDDAPIDQNILRSVLVYLVAYVGIFITAVFLLSLENYDMVTTFTAAAATFNNVGPGLELVGPTGNFAFFSDFSKWVMIFSMLTGRLELFPMLVLFSPVVWKEMLVRSRVKRGR